MDCTSITVEYSRDMAKWAYRLGGAFTMDGYRVIFKRVEGESVLRFHATGISVSLDDIHYLTMHLRECRRDS